MRSSGHRATTTSLEALRKYSQALVAIDTGDRDLGQSLLLEAIEIDMEPYHEQMERLSEQMEQIELHIEDGTLEEIQAASQAATRSARRRRIPY